MSNVSVDISMSLDGFITGANPSIELPLGEGGEQLHQWLYTLESWRKRHGLAGGEANADAAILDETFVNVGAVVMGRNMFNSGERAWGENPPFHMPVFVLTHEPCDPLPKQGGTSFTFVNRGIEDAIQQAQRAAGNLDVSIAGGANIIQQAMSASLVDELQVHLVPVMLGKGRRLFEYIGGPPTTLERVRTATSYAVTHLKFRIVK